MTRAMNRVVITGAGTINALGASVPATLEAMREGRCGIGRKQIICRSRMTQDRRRPGSRAVHKITGSDTG